MKSIINGLRYDTEKATLICEDSYGNSGDFRYYEEALYVTAKGNYFLAGKGGAASKYGQSCGQNTTCGGSGIDPISKEEAFEYCSKISAKACEEFFPDMIEEA